VRLGLVLLAAFVLTGRGLGASGAFASCAAGVAHALSPALASSSPLFARYLGAGGPWNEWLLFEGVGVAIGAFGSAAVARRLRVVIERGPGVSPAARLALGFAGGTLMGLGAALARGCTSGLSLTGGALLSVGAWAFTAAAFAGGYLVAPLVKRAWR
jgi:hypothetical protein